MFLEAECCLRTQFETISWLRNFVFSIVLAPVLGKADGKTGLDPQDV